jgi:hypothetical protein
MEFRPNLSFTLALSVYDPTRAEAHDVLLRGTAEQTIGELARRLAGYLGHPTSSVAGEPLVYSLRVERTGEQLRLDAPIGTVDLLEGDTVALRPPGNFRRRPRWADDLEEPEARPDRRIIPLRPRAH